MIKKILLFTIKLTVVLLFPLFFNNCGKWGTNPTKPTDDTIIEKTQDQDTDGDGISDEVDDDIDGDGILNEVDDDIDGDGILNADEEEVIDDSDESGGEDSDGAEDTDKEAEGITKIDAGESYTCVLFESGKLKCWGKTETIIEPSYFGSDKQIVDVSCGTFHYCILLNSGELFCSGDNLYGQLGIGSTQSNQSYSNKVDLGTGRTAKKISGGFRHTCALLDNDTVKCWGENTYGKLGQGHINNLGDGENEMGDILSSINLGTGATVIDIIAGNNHTCALMTGESIKCWGSNMYGQLGQEGKPEKNIGDETGEMGDLLKTTGYGTNEIANQLSAKSNSNCVLLNSNRVKCWGFNESGMLGLGYTGNLGNGYADMGDYLNSVKLGTDEEISDIKVGYYHSCVIFKDGSVKCWGSNSFGQFGLGDNQNRGDTTNMGEDLPFVDTGGTVKKLALGGNHTCAVFDDNSVKCWGKNDAKQLGYGDTTSRCETGGNGCVADLDKIDF